MRGRGRGTSRRRPAGEDGYTLVEAMVSLLIISVGLLALLGELTSYLKVQSGERAQATAVRMMTSSVENARTLTDGALADLAGAAYTRTVTEHGITYTQTTTVQQCSIEDPQSACSSPLGSASTDTRVTVNVAWLQNGAPKSLQVATSVADSATSIYRSTGSGSLGALAGGSDGTPSTVTVSAMTVSPTSTTVDAAGRPSGDVTVSLSTVGLTAATSSIPVTWTDDTGGHQWPLGGGPNLWSVTIPAASITKVAAGSVVFAASVPGTQALPTATLTVTTAPAFVGSCTVSPQPIPVNVVTRRTTTPVTLACTTTGLTATDRVRVSYTRSLGTAEVDLTSSNGTSWTATLPTNTQMGTLPTSTFTFTPTRLGDGVSGSSQARLVVLL